LTLRRCTLAPKTSSRSTAATLTARRLRFACKKTACHPQKRKCMATSRKERLL